MKGIQHITAILDVESKHRLTVTKEEMKMVHATCKHLKAQRLIPGVNIRWELTRK